ncbi:DASS family sodium-coupled anion symporter [Nocardia uniformis]|uniref:Sodium-dependent dicarboxylate transporter SdcS n=1 Tax=Nocardia uniformis TaxID=53432 RepID=A0A849CDA9_9NOCA|nr:DASS family sodium-coupled anion symporter [Nocardia uniformis]NNH73109.1 DASS family sodium-coupled anion symporter [Nocardia uniformis]
MSQTDASPVTVGDSSRTSLRRWLGLGLGVVFAVLVYWVLPDSLSVPARSTAAVAILMATWWMTEAIPLAATALVPLVAFPVLSVAPIGTRTLDPDEEGVTTGDLLGAAAPYADKIIFLFLGGFLLAATMQRWGLHRRIALRTIGVVGTQPVRLVAGFMLATAFLSMWVSNTATTVMMLPIGVSVILLTKRLLEDDDSAVDPNFATALMLGIAYAASIGSLGTIIGTPPNGLLVSNLAKEGINISFGTWMLFGVPIAAVFLVLAWLVLTRLVFPPRISEIPGGREAIAAQTRELGTMSRGETTVLVVFVTTALAWILIPTLFGSDGVDALRDAIPLLTRVGDEVIAMTMAIALFIIPVGRNGERLLDWETAKQIPWGILLLFGGGLSLANQIRVTGLGAWIGDQVAAIGTVPIVVLVVVVAALVLLLTELTSNTATTATFLPIIIGVAGGMGLDPALLAVPVALAATSAFMLPVATPPNAVVFGSGHVRIGQMIRAGIVLNVIGMVLITIAMFTIAGPILGVER